MLCSLVNYIFMMDINSWLDSLPVYYIHKLVHYDH